MTSNSDDQDGSSCDDPVAAALRDGLASHSLGRAASTEEDEPESASEEYEVSDDPARLDIAVIHGFLSRCPWATGIPVETVQRSIAGSMCWGVYREGAQVAFARVITDAATFAYLADVFVLEAHRRRGVARKLLTAIFSQPMLHGLRRFVLVTQTAHGLYEKFGFRVINRPDTFMQVFVPDIYTTPPAGEGPPVAVDATRPLS